ncbi:uncharacterized protein LAESUDRAFT_388704 [Laetiporus sulphureus 93-53]|uniref:Crinkler effector protein N-terminal domain-containing protein n=1 Tax=Laetiporus sulphureus 93-53 TaxID=1314785 RepID=A0A165CGW9_9APHY|nr:uncharacterized protein LAESUDRAFT_388704 [Laetiporus sulphureus 93-53]KZT02786.1 hypothetical protein LAESUDRAFT_388704 [Laetiporus sulphureus 93-53]
MATLMDIWCLLIDHKKEPIGTLFTVKISSDADVNDLRAKVKEKRSVDTAGVDSARLIVWRCMDSTIIFDDEDPKTLKDQVSEAFSNQKLEVLRVSETIADLKLSKEETLLVQMPEPIAVPTVAQAWKRKKHDEIMTPSKRTKTYEEEQDKNVEAAKKAPTPSQAASLRQFEHIQKGPGWVLNGRPAQRVGPPIGLYHPVFDEFKEKLKGDGEISLDVRRLVREFITASASVYQTKEDRMKGIQHTLGKLVGGPLEKVVGEGFASDRVLLAATNEWSAKILICEVKNEIGTGIVDPYTQACLAYQRYSSDDDKYLPLRRKSYCPCIILAIAGPWLCVAGAVYTRAPIVQPLTGYEWTAPECLFDDQSRLERMVHSLNAATCSFRTYYTSTLLKAIPAAEGMHGFPYISSYDGNTFSYVEQLGGNDAQVFKVNEGGVLRVVKFTTQYNEAAHRFLSEEIEGESFAPALYHVSQRTFGGRRMVVMDYVDGESAFGRTLTEGHFDQLKKALERLHTKELVFGDLRTPNIILKKEHVMLIDFDWCGIDGKANYPIDLNSSAGWVTGVGPGEVMRKEHDDAMLQKLQLAEMV